MIKKYMVATLLLSVSIFKAMPVKIYVGREKARKVRAVLRERKRKRKREKEEEESRLVASFCDAMAREREKQESYIRISREEELFEQERNNIKEIVTQFLPENVASIAVDYAVGENKSAKPSWLEKQKKKKPVKEFVMVP